MTGTNERQNRQKKIAAFIISNAIVWGAVMIGISFVLKGTGYTDKVLPILGGGAGFSVVILSSLLVEKKQK
jgi:hypothetical protein